MNFSNKINTPNNLTTFLNGSIVMNRDIVYIGGTIRRLYTYGSWGTLVSSLGRKEISWRFNRVGVCKNAHIQY